MSTINAPMAYVRENYSQMTVTVALTRNYYYDLLGFETSDGFLEAQNGRVFKNKGENADVRFLYLGQCLKMYIGCDTKLSEEGEETVMERVSCQCDTQGLLWFWDNAWNTVC